MNIGTTLTRIGTGTAIAAAATAGLAVPARAMPAPPPDPGGPSIFRPGIPSGSTPAEEPTDWQDVGRGVAGGVLLSGGALGAAWALRRSRRPGPA